MLTHPTPSASLLLQAAEATKLTAEAAAKVGQHAANNAFTALLWLGFILAAVIAVWQFFDNRKLRKEKDEAVAARYVTETQVEVAKSKAIKEALQEARADWQREMAIDLAHEQQLFEQSRKQYEAEITRLREDNKEKERQILDANTELRKQVAKDAQLFEAMNNSQRLTARTLHASNANQQEIMRVLGVAFPDARIRDPYTIDVL